MQDAKQDSKQDSVGHKAYNAAQVGACGVCGGAGSVYDANAVNEAGGRGVRSRCGCVGGWDADHAAARPKRYVWPAHANGYSAQ